jgi:transketolase
MMELASLEATEELVERIAHEANSIRKRTIQMVYDGGSGHCGGSLSAADILAVLYFHTLRLDPKNPEWPDRDRFILSKGHACPALYAALAGRGYFPVEDLGGFRQIDGGLRGHPERITPGVETVTGSLGQGFSAGLGMALGLRRAGRDAKVYVILGDGEIQEGQVWETAMSAGHHRLDNMICFVDVNGLQGDGTTEEILDLAPLPEKWRAFNWHVQEIDGHSIPEILDAIEIAWETPGAPHMILARTVKGKGVSFMENVAAWHGTAPPSDEQLAQALAELDAAEGRQA